MGHAMSEVLIGAADWQVQAWRDSYYPDDLPAEWQLGYYANEFTTTFIRYHAFSNEDDSEYLAEMMEGCQEQFHPVIVFNIADGNTPATDAIAHWLDLVDSDMGLQRPAGVMLTGDSGMFDRSLLREWRERIPSQLPLALDIAGPCSRLDGDWLYENDYSLVWHEAIAADLQGECWLARLSLSDDSRQVASQVRALSSQLSADRPVCLIAEKGYQDIDRLRELVTIIRLVIG